MKLINKKSLINTKNYKKNNKNHFTQKAPRINLTDLGKNNKCIFHHLISMITTSIMKKHFKAQKIENKYNKMEWKFN